MIFFFVLSNIIIEAKDIWGNSQVGGNGRKVEVTAESKGKSGNGQKVRASDKLKNKSEATAERSKSRQGPKTSRDGGKKPIPTEKRNSLNQHPNQVTSKFYKNPFFAEDLKILDFTIGFTRKIFFARENSGR